MKTTDDKQARLAEIADRMKYAQGKAREALDREIGQLIGVKDGDTSFSRNRERLGDWEAKHRSRS